MKRICNICFNVIHSKSLQSKTTKILLIVFLVVFLFNFILYNRNINSLYRKQLKDYNEYTTIQVEKACVNILNSVKESMFRLNYDDRFLDFVKNFENTYQNNIYMMNRLEQLHESNECIKTVSFYISNQNIVFNSEDGRIYKHSDFPHKRFFQEMDEQNIKVFNLENAKYATTDFKFAPIVCKFPTDNKTAEDALMIVIDYNKVHSNISKNLTLGEKRKLLITTKDAEIVVGRIIEFRNLFDELLKNKTFENPLSFYTNKSLISGYYSNDLKLNFFINLDLDGNSDIDNAISIYIFITLIIMIIALIIFIFFSKKTVFKPLQSMVLQLNGNSQHVSTEGEIYAINSAFDKLERQNEVIKQRYESMLPIFREKFLSDILTKSIYKYDEVKAKCTYYGINIEIALNIKYIVMIIICDIESSNEIEKDLLNTNIKIIVDGFMEEEFKGFCIEVNNNVCVALNLPNDRLQEEGYGYALNFAHGLHNRIRENLSDNVFIGLGSIVNIEKLSVSYYEACDILNYKKIVKNNIVSIYQLKNYDNKIFEYPYTLENQFLKHVKAGERDEALDCLKQLFESFNNGQLMDNRDIEYMVFRIASSLQKLAYQHNIPVMTGNDFERFIKIMKKEHIEVVEKEFTEIVIKIIDDENFKVSDDDFDIKRILNYINENYTDNIQLIDLENKFNIGRYYIGHLIKEKTGIGFNDYVNSKRIAKSVELLCNTNMSIKEISQVIGYTYPYYFNRIFKKIHGITPLEFRVFMEENN